MSGLKLQRVRTVTLSMKSIMSLRGKFPLELQKKHTSIKYISSIMKKQRTTNTQKTENYVYDNFHTRYIKEVGYIKMEAPLNCKSQNIY